MKLKFTFIAIILTVGLSACSTEPPKCSDPKTFALVRQIIIEHFGKNQSTVELGSKELEDKILIQNPRASSYDEKIKKYNCEGTLIVRGKANQCKVDIKYASQLDDQNQHLVTVEGVSIWDTAVLSSALSE